LGAARRGAPSGSARPRVGDVRGRLDRGPGGAAGHAVADPARPLVAGALAGAGGPARPARPGRALLRADRARGSSRLRPGPGGGAKRRDRAVRAQRRRRGGGRGLPRGSAVPGGGAGSDRHRNGRVESLDQLRVVDAGAREVARAEVARR
jgi:hypothetical protein